MMAGVKPKAWFRPAEVGSVAATNESIVGSTKYAIPETATTPAGKVLQFYGERAWVLVICQHFRTPPVSNISALLPCPSILLTATRRGACSWACTRVQLICNHECMPHVYRFRLALTGPLLLQANTAAYNAGAESECHRQSYLSNALNEACLASC